MKQLSNTVKALFNNQGLLSSRMSIPELHNPAGHFQSPPGNYTGYSRQWIPNYGRQELHQFLPPPPAYWPLPPLPNCQPAAVSLTQSVCDQQSAITPMRNSCTDQQPPLTQRSAAQNYYNSGQQSSSDSSTHTSSLSFDDSDNEYVPPLPPPLPDSLKDKHDENDISDNEEIRFPLKAQQINSQGPDNKQKRKVKDNRVYPITEVFNHVFLSECLAESVSRPNFSLNLVTKFFTEEVRLTSNVSGRDKNQLDKDMIAAIKVASFTMWPLKSSENEVKAWRDCVKAIDEGGRRLRRRVAKLNESEGATKENQ